MNIKVIHTRDGEMMRGKWYKSEEVVIFPVPANRCRRAGDAEHQLKLSGTDIERLGVPPGSTIEFSESGAVVVTISEPEGER